MIRERGGEKSWFGVGHEVGYGKKLGPQYCSCVLSAESGGLRNWIAHCIGQIIGRVPEHGRAMLLRRLCISRWVIWCPGIQGAQPNRANQDITIPEAESHAAFRRCHTNSLSRLHISSLPNARVLVTRIPDAVIALPIGQVSTFEDV